MYRLKVTSEDENVIEQVRAFAVDLGCDADVLFQAGNDESRTDIVRTRSDFHELYAITRGPQIGYIGVTKVGARNRINFHLARGEQANDPFVQWLAQGLILCDIKAGVIDTRNNKTDAYNRETELCVQYKPLFNKQKPTLVDQIGGLKTFNLDALKNLELEG
jgi:hypothetical protein